MNIKTLLFGLIVGASLATATDTLTVNAPKNVIDTYNEFAKEVNIWTHMRADTPPTAYSWTAKKQWEKKVKPAFRALDLVLKNE